MIMIVKTPGSQMGSPVFQMNAFGNIESIFWKKKSGNSVTRISDNLRPSRREVKNDVWKYPQIIVIGLYAVCRYLLDNQDRAHSLQARVPGRGMVRTRDYCVPKTTKYSPRH